MSRPYVEQAAFELKHPDEPGWKPNTNAQNRTLSILFQTVMIGGELQIIHSDPNPTGIGRAAADLSICATQLVLVHGLHHDTHAEEPLRRESLADIGGEVARANGLLAVYLDTPPSHARIDNALRVECVAGAVGHLRVAAYSLADMAGQPLETLHIGRLEELARS